MALRGRIGAYQLHSTHDPRETTKAARAKFLARFEAEVDRWGAARARTASPGRVRARAYFARLALKSARARARKKRPTASATAGSARPRRWGR